MQVTKLIQNNQVICESTFKSFRFVQRAEKLCYPRFSTNATIGSLQSGKTRLKSLGKLPCRLCFYQLNILIGGLYLGIIQIGLSLGNGAIDL